MPQRDHYLALDDHALLADCDIHRHRTSGPGGQHRNKVASAIRLRHRPTGTTANASESRSQHDNRTRALRRLRMKLACDLRSPVDLADLHLPTVVQECIAVPRKAAARGPAHLTVSAKGPRFWQVAAFLLDLLAATGGRLAPTARCLGLTTSSLSGALSRDRHVLAAAQAIRRRHGHGKLR